MNLKALVFSITIGLFTTPSIYANGVMQDMYGINNQEADLRLTLQNDVITLSEKLNQRKNKGYVDLYIQHKPKYKIIVLVTQNTSKAEQAKIKKLVPTLSKYIEIKTVTRSLAQQNKESKQLSDLINRVKKPFPYTSAFDLETQKFIVTVENKNDANKVKWLIQRLKFKKDIKIVISSLPQPENQKQLE